MTSTLPTAEKDRNIIVDVIRGFALIGVLIVNFASNINEQTPETILKASKSSFDSTLVQICDVFFEWKFMTLFSMLFGYGFGLILQSLDRKNINPNLFFFKRMFWLFIFGCIHTLFWWGDVLHLYAISGIILLTFRNNSNKSVFLFSILFLFVVPILISYLLRNQPETFTDENIRLLYSKYKNGNIIDVFKANISFYYKTFLISGSDLHDIFETTGRFMLGYYFLRLNLFQFVETKITLFKKSALVSAPLMIAYFTILLMTRNEILHTEKYLLNFTLSIGIISTSIFYVSLLVLAYLHFGMNKFFAALQSLGKMTLTNYLLISTILIILLYGLGFGKLGEISILNIWIYALLWIFIEIIFSVYWLKKFRYGPVEWIWRQLTHGKQLPLKK
jgi:uncharacterized protein